MEAEPKKLYRSRDKVIGGVCAGLAKYFNVDVVPLRIIFVIAFLLGTLGFWIYIVMWIMMPLEPYSGR